MAFARITKAFKGKDWESIASVVGACAALGILVLDRITVKRQREVNNLFEDVNTKLDSTLQTLKGIERKVAIAVKEKERKDGAF